MDECLRFIDDNQRIKFTHAYNNPIRYPLAIDKIEKFYQLNILKSDIIKIGRYKKKNVFVRMVDSYPEIWVNIDYKNYRNAYRRYLKDFFGISDISSDYHVDHTISRAMCRKSDVEYVQLILIRACTNVKFGASVEKNMVSFQRVNKVLNINMFFLFKLLNMDFPKNMDDAINNMSMNAKKISEYLYVDMKDVYISMFQMFIYRYDIFKEKKRPAITYDEIVKIALKINDYE